jgi:p-cymene monooxygenase electron transfer component
MLHFWRKLISRTDPQPALLRPSEVEILVRPGQTLLEAALGEGVAFPHNCTVGTCASCKCRLISGEVRAGVDFGYTLSKEELQAGYILACQAHPTSPVVVSLESAGTDAPPPEQFIGRIKGRTHLTHDILAVEVGLDRPMKYIAGQYAAIRAGDLSPRSYSFADPPDRIGKDILTFFVRKSPGGAFTERLFGGAFDGANLEIGGPHGQFFLHAGDGPMICLAGGSGLAPLISLLMDARRKNIRRRCILLFGARSRRDLYKLDAIEGMKADWLGEFDFLPVLSDDPVGSDWTGRRGLVTDILRGSLTADPDLARRGQAYMCGPPPMIDAAVSNLVRAGMDLGDIHYDKFTNTVPTT